MDDIDAVMRLSPVIPILTIKEAGQARPIAEALVAGGLTNIEVTLRTPAAYEAIREIAAVPDTVVGAGSVLNGHDLEACVQAGAQYAVSPGFSESVTYLAREKGVPYLPGVATASDIMRSLDLGLTHFKFFPAVAAGGISALKALSAPFPHCRFCPTGGITEEAAPGWLALESVLCVGGSWVIPSDLSSPDEIADQAKKAMALRGSDEHL